MPVPNIEEFARQMQGIALVTTHNQQRANRMAKPIQEGKPLFEQIQMEEQEPPHHPISIAQDVPPASAVPVSAAEEHQPVITTVRPLAEAKRENTQEIGRPGIGKIGKRELRRAVILSEILGPPKSRRI